MDPPPNKLCAVLKMAIIIFCIVAGTIRSGADEPLLRDGRLFRAQYHVATSTLCNAGACLDIDGDGRREFVYSARKTQLLQMLDAASGKVIWSKRVEGEQHSLAAFDIDRDGRFELLSAVSKPGRLYVLDPSGAILNT